MIPFKYWGVWAKRFRKRCGYGVHSPFAFNFITGVVFEKGHYYAFETLDNIYFPGFFQRFSYLRKRTHFLFRLANYVHPDYFVTDTSLSSPEIAYMKAACQYARWQKIDSQTDFSAGKMLVYIDTSDVDSENSVNEALQNITEDSALLLKVHSNWERKKYVERFVQSPICGVTFDLYDYLLVFFDRKLFKQHYVVNFFD